MQVYGLIYICPECRKVALFSPNPGDTFNLSPMLCADDGYMMKMIRVDEVLIDKLLKGIDVNASKDTTGS